MKQKTHSYRAALLLYSFLGESQPYLCCVHDCCGNGVRLYSNSNLEVTYFMMFTMSTSIIILRVDHWCTNTKQKYCRRIRFSNMIYMA